MDFDDIEKEFILIQEINNLMDDTKFSEYDNNIRNKENLEKIQEDIELYKKIKGIKEISVPLDFNKLEDHLLENELNKKVEDNMIQNDIDEHELEILTIEDFLDVPINETSNTLFNKKTLGVICMSSLIGTSIGMTFGLIPSILGLGLGSTSGIIISKYYKSTL